MDYTSIIAETLDSLPVLHELGTDTTRLMAEFVPTQADEWICLQCQKRYLRLDAVEHMMYHFHQSRFAPDQWHDTFQKGTTRTTPIGPPYSSHREKALWSIAHPFYSLIYCHPGTVLFHMPHINATRQRAAATLSKPLNIFLSRGYRYVLGRILLLQLPRNDFFADVTCGNYEWVMWTTRYPSVMPCIDDAIEPDAPPTGLSPMSLPLTIHAPAPPPVSPPASIMDIE